MPRPSDTPAEALVKVTKANANITSPTGATGSPCRALLVGTAGTANLRDARGNDLADVPLQQGYNPISVLQVRTGGTADDIWALF
jgi:hypothetical protein